MKIKEIELTNDLEVDYHNGLYYKKEDFENFLIEKNIHIIDEIKAIEMCKEKNIENFSLDDYKKWIGKDFRFEYRKDIRFGKFIRWNKEKTKHFID